MDDWHPKGLLSSLFVKVPFRKSNEDLIFLLIFPLLFGQILSSCFLNNAKQKKKIKLEISRSLEILEKNKSSSLDFRKGYVHCIRFDRTKAICCYSNPLNKRTKKAIITWPIKVRSTRLRFIYFDIQGVNLNHIITKSLAKLSFLPPKNIHF